MSYAVRMVETENAKNLLLHILKDVGGLSSIGRNGLERLTAVLQGRSPLSVSKIWWQKSLRF
ncbi:MAG: hypothetical protein F6K30_20325 [Cyanothece sp. SIO2G6]|nr:hypothetical protein [Cyanothece sp. SIO2G6]